LRKGRGIHKAQSNEGSRQRGSLSTNKREEYRGDVGEKSSWRKRIPGESWKERQVVKFKGAGVTLGKESRTMGRVKR